MSSLFFLIYNLSYACLSVTMENYCHEWWDRQHLHYCIYVYCCRSSPVLCQPAQCGCQHCMLSPPTAVWTEGGLGPIHCRLRKDLYCMSSKMEELCVILSMKIPVIHFNALIQQCYYHTICITDNFIPSFIWKYYICFIRFEYNQYD
jgi:hypothetical protein